MGNCQAAEAATVVIQHPGGKVERLYWPTSAADVMRSNPGHYVALVILCLSEQDKKLEGADGGARVTRIKLLKPKDMLLLGQVYRLITSHEVTKALKARKYEKMKKAEYELIKKKAEEDGQSNGRQSNLESKYQVAKQERDNNNNNKHRTSSSSNSQSASRGRQWRPSLQSISESAS